MFLKIKNLKGERWKEAPIKKTSKGYKYYVSDHGRIVSVGGTTETLLNGFNNLKFPYLKLSSRKPRTSDQLKKYETLSKKYDKALSEHNKIARALKKASSKEKATFKKQLEQTKKLLTEAATERKKYIASEEKLRRTYKIYPVYKLVAETFISKAPSDKHKFVLHLDFNSHNNHFKNLKWVTQKELTKHHLNNPNVKRAKRYRKANPIVANHTITEKQVLDIQKMLQAGKTLSVIAKKYGVSDMQIHRIKTGENWGSITGIKYKKPAPKKTITKKVDSKKVDSKKSKGKKK